MSWSRRTRRVAVAVVMGSLAVGLAGCSGEPGAAAIVDGSAIKVSSVRDAVDDLSAIGVNMTANQVLVNLVQVPTFARVAQDNGLGASQQDSTNLLNQVAEQNGKKPLPSYHDSTLEVAQYSVLYQKMQTATNGGEIAQAVSTGLGKLDVQLSPRFGTLDLSTWSVTATAPEWIDQTGASAS